MSLHPWSRFEFLSAVAFILFLLAGLAGLVAVWVGLAWAPAAVVAVTPEVATRIFVLEAVLITASISLAFAARTMVVREWLRIAPTAKPERVKSLHSFVCGVGLMSAWSALLVPVYAAALLSMSSFASLIVVGMLYASVRGLLSGHAALAEYKAARSSASGSPSGRSATAAIVAAGFSIGAIVAVLAKLTPLVIASSDVIVAPVAAQLETVRVQISFQSQDLPLAEQIHAERVSAETEALKREVAAMKRGVASETDVHAARQRLLQAQMEGLRVIGEARNALANLKRSEAELDARLRHAASAAPALPGR